MVYLDTNVYNELADRLTPQEIRGLRAALDRAAIEAPVLSPVVVLEIAQTSDEIRRERLVYLIQHLCARTLLAEPEELILQFIVSKMSMRDLDGLAAPDSHCRTHFQTIWDEVRTDLRRSFIISDEVRSGLRLLKKTYKLLQGLAERPLPLVATLPDLKEAKGMAEAERLVRAAAADSRRNSVSNTLNERVRQACWLVCAALVGSRSSVFPELIEPLWDAVGVRGVQERLEYLFKNMAFLIAEGPVFTMGAWLALTPADDGNLFDGLHLMYPPYVDSFFTLDKRIPEFVRNFQTNPTAAKVQDARSYIEALVAAATRVPS